MPEQALGGMPVGLRLVKEINLQNFHVHAENRKDSSKDSSRNSRKRGATSSGETSSCNPKSKRHRADIDKENLQAAKSEVCV